MFDNNIGIKTTFRGNISKQLIGSRGTFAAGSFVIRENQAHVLSPHKQIECKLVYHENHI